MSLAVGRNWVWCVDTSQCRVTEAAAAAAAALAYFYLLACIALLTCLFCASKLNVQRYYGNGMFKLHSLIIVNVRTVKVFTAFRDTY